MTEKELDPIVQSILDAFPMFDAWFCQLSDEQRRGMRAAWTRQLSTLEPSDVREAAAGILDGRVPMPKNYEFDRLGFELKSWGNVAAANRIERQKTETLREQAAPNADASGRAVARRFGRAIKCASAWGAALRAGHVTTDQNAEAMAQIHRHHKRGDVNLPWPQVSGKDQKSIVEFWQD